MEAVPAIYEYLIKQKSELKLEINYINIFMCGGASLDVNTIEEYKKVGIDLNCSFISKLAKKVITFT